MENIPASGVGQVGSGGPRQKKRGDQDELFQHGLLCHGGPERSFSRAAERLHITQQTLSAHIAKLEGELGAKLLVRSIPLELTYAGEVFLEYALDFQRRASSLEREFQDIPKISGDCCASGLTIPGGIL